MEILSISMETTRLGTKLCPYATILKLSIHIQGARTQVIACSVAELNVALSYQGKKARIIHSSEWRLSP